LIGAQWGDEGKGRVVDVLAREANIVARYNGGDNAGHSITIGDKLVRLHLIPSGIFYPHVTCLLGSGMVINPKNLLREMDEVRAAGYEVAPTRLQISDGAHLVLPTHVALDEAMERARGDGAIGTTKRGIGVAYATKMLRTNLRAGDLRDAERFADLMHERVQQTNQQLADEFRAAPLDADALCAEYHGYALRIAPYIANTTRTVHEALARDEHIVAEGAQGVLLDIDLGTYPFVTSSSTGVAGALSGLGVGPQTITRVVGVAKAFSTRVGSGPFPTELHDGIGARLRGTGANPWDEFGSTTGRARRTGWLDLVALRYAIRTSGITELVLTKLDVLSGFDQLNVCVAYDLDGERTTEFVSDAAVLDKVTPVYVALDGWRDDLTRARRRTDLPAQALTYVDQLEAQLGAPISMISVGPEREQMIV
ncbi:MAG: adenylosuccinate synthase, partial [Chloroflexi bacterium]|nr:adenylosuccinate synthase [Chloroflexota bacterium]